MDVSEETSRVRRSRPPVMSDVARLAGVSHQTVSRVINGSPHVRPDTREKVEAAMRQLDYRPNRLARALVTGRSHTLGVVSFDTMLYGPASTLLGIERAAHEAGLHPVKINAVLVRDSNLHEAPHLLDWALRHGYHLRFIEHMPLDADHLWSRESMVTADEILELLEAEYTLRAIGQRTSAPAEEFEVVDGPQRDAWADPVGRLGVIASVTRPFCRDCDRLRLTADGKLRNRAECLAKPADAVVALPCQLRRLGRAAYRACDRQYRRDRQKASRQWRRAFVDSGKLLRRS